MVIKTQKDLQVKIEDEIIQQLQEDLKSCKSVDDLSGKDGAIKKLIKKTVERMLDAELTEHLGYEKHSPAGKGTGNSRNGSSGKTLKSDYGPVSIEIPRDRNAEFEPTVVKKHQTMLGALDEKIISMSARGMSVRDIQAHLQRFTALTFLPLLSPKSPRKFWPWSRNGKPGPYPRSISSCIWMPSITRSERTAAL
jgi:putative transposase